MPKPKLTTVGKPAPSAAPEIKPVLVTKAALSALLDEYLIASAKASQFDAKKKALAAEIEKTWFTKYGPKLETAECLVTRVPGSNAHIDGAKLLQAGVRPSVIKACTNVVTYTYPRVTRKRAPDDVVQDLEQALKKGRRRT